MKSKIKKKKGLHSNFVLFFVQYQVISSPKPDAQLAKGGGPCLSFAHFSMQFCNPGDPKGRAMAQCPPPKYAPASKPQVLENCLVVGSRRALFFEQLKFCWKTPETSRKICEHLFCFPHLEHRRRQREGGQRLPQLKFHL